MVQKFYRPDQVAELLQVSKRTIYRLIADGDLIAVKIRSGPLRIPEENLEIYIKNTVFDPLEV